MSKIGAFITITDPYARGDNYIQCLESASHLCDRVLTVDGNRTWPEEFNWPIIGEHFQWGYENCDADWVIHLDCDFVFHEKDHAAVRRLLKNSGASAVMFYKKQFILPDRYNVKSRLALAVNKGQYGNRIRFDAGGDLCQPSLDGELIKISELAPAQVGFWNYEKLTKTKAQIMDDVGRMDRAYYTHFGEFLYSTNGHDDSAFEGWYEMIAGRFAKPHEHIKLEAHPAVMQDLIRSLTPNQFGYNGFGLVEGKVYA